MKQSMFLGKAKNFLQAVNKIFKEIVFYLTFLLLRSVDKTDDNYK